MEVTVSGNNLAQQIQAAQDNPNVSKVKIQGGGSINAPVILRKHTVFDSSTYSCDQTDATGTIVGYSVTDYGCFRVADNVLVEGTWRPPQALDNYFKHGKGWDWQDPYLQKVQALTAEELAGTGTTILEPNYTNDTAPPLRYPSIIVFQALGDSHSSHTGKSEGIAIVGFHIKGRQTVYDGGIRSSIQFGNAHRSLAMWNYLEDTGSIGISFGGSALENDFYANDVVACRNVFSGVAAANTATVNTEKAYIFENYHRRPGHHEPKFGGGVCGHDHETNSGADHTKEIWVYNNLYDYEGGAFDGVGSAVCLQDPYFDESPGTHRGATYAVNNVIIGGRNDRVHRYLSNGLFLNGLNNCTAINNYVFRTGQNAIQAYNLRDSLLQDNDFEATGGGGQVSIHLNGVHNTTVRRCHYRDREGLGINTAAGIIENCGTGNVYEQNLINGEDRPSLVRIPCP